VGGVNWSINDQAVRQEVAAVSLYRTLKIAASALSSLFLATAASSGVLAAPISPYPAGQSGYDVSYPQCGAVTPAGAFGIVGVNGGRPFSSNSCLAGEYAAAPGPTAASLYINTGYSGAYGKSITPACSGSSSSVSGTSRQRQAWAIGCSEAEDSTAYATQQGATVVAAWWLDVETANSWSSSNLSLNRYTIQGAVTRLAQSGLPVGIYSSASLWSTITGGAFTPVGAVADRETAGGSCTAPFTSTPVWLVQSTTSGFDSDLAC
jgi:hypothetical protein